MALRPAAFTTPYEVIRPTPFQCLSAVTPSGEANDDGILKKGEVVWTHKLLPQVQGHRATLGFIDAAGEILVDVTSLRLKPDNADSAPKL